MVDKMWSMNSVLTSACWGGVALLQLTAWVVVAAAPGRLVFVVLLLAGSCALSALAAAMTVRGYMVRTCAMLRVLHGGQCRPIDGGLRPVP